ncbi:MAG TPA: hypothetical protein VJV23_03330 [Candidatus Polarisedimenticolia bacterium]|nr:hypothetical protein [Candidatus Polarisedimenticolia bacterium]
MPDRGAPGGQGDPLARLPHTGAARLPSRVLRLDPGRAVTAERCLAAGDPCLNGDGFLPSVLVVELMAQAGGLLMEQEPGGSAGVLAGVRRLHLHAAPGAGDTVTVECRLERRLGELYLLSCDARSGTRALAHGRIHLRRTRRARA